MASVIIMVVVVVVVVVVVADEEGRWSSTMRSKQAAHDFNHHRPPIANCNPPTAVNSGVAGPFAPGWLALAVRHAVRASCYRRR